MSSVVESRSSESSSGRLLSLDVFRGITIAGMTLVNNPGTGKAIYSPLEHAEWNGWTPTDLVFPFFLFIVGVSITLAFARRVENGGSQRDLYLKIIRRTLIIFALGLVLNGFPYYNLSTIRIPGVLQRIALCYFFASLIFLHTTWRTQALIGVGLLLFYWLIMTVIPAPGYMAGDLSKEGSLASYIDRTILGPHIWKAGKVYDPEGILSTIPAIVSTLCGILTGHLLRSRRTPMEKVAAMFVAGAVGVALGWAWNFWFPINKDLWTSSYVVFTAGLALQFLAFCYWLVDLKNYRTWAKPFVIFGVNALALFFLSNLMVRLMMFWKLPQADGSEGNLQTWIYEHFFAPFLSPINASLAYAIAFLLLWLGIMTIFYRRKIFIKV